MEEIYKDIVGYEGIYKISNLSNIYSLRTNKILKQYIHTNGYKYIGLRKNSNDKNAQMFMIHRLIAITFLPNSNNYPVVDHIDGNKLNNNLNNLRWLSYSDNVRNGHINNKNYNNKKKEVYKLDMNDNILEKYDSVKDAVLKNNFTFNASIIECCKNKKESFNGYKWKYVNEEQTYIPTLNEDEYFINIDQIYDCDYNNKYCISNYGKLFNNEKQFYYKLSDATGYYKVTLVDINGNSKDYMIHRLVAYFFISKENDKVVNHIDENKKNNYYKNLEWLNSTKENTIYSLGKKVAQIDINTNQILATFNTIREAESMLNLSVGNISKCINGKSKTYKGFIWKQID